MDADLRAQLERARELGFLGPGPVEAHVVHAGGFVAALAGIRGRVIDLGSGGGVPGLVVAQARPDLEVVLVDAMARRGAFLEAAVADLGLTNTEVMTGRAEALGRGPLRGTAAAVLARGFGSPAVTAECAAPFLRVGGHLMVSEPPEPADRWPALGLAQLGLGLGPRHPGPPAIQVLTQVSPCPAAYPRREGRPAKRPLFG